MSFMKWFVSFLILAGICLLISAFLQPIPGKGAWFTALAGDWAIRIGNTEYEIGNSADGSNTYTIFRWKPITLPDLEVQQECIETIVDNVLVYNYGSGYILAKTPHGFTWLNEITGALSRAQSTEELSKKAPSEVLALQASLKQPGPSERYILFALAGVIFIVSLGVLLRKSLTM